MDMILSAIMVSGTILTSTGLICYWLMDISREISHLRKRQ